MEALERADSDVRALKADNLKLYERVKYLQSYDDIRSNPQRVREEAARAPLGFDEGDLEQKYGSMYEETVNPFAVFSRKERYQRYKDLGMAERVMLRGTRFFMANKYTRTCLFAYTVFLHALVFFVLYAWQTSVC
jgi:homeobox protein cut-like